MQAALGSSDKLQSGPNPLFLQGEYCHFNFKKFNAFTTLVKNVLVAAHADAAQDAVHKAHNAPRAAGGTMKTRSTACQQVAPLQYCLLSIITTQAEAFVHRIDIQASPQGF